MSDTISRRQAIEALRRNQEAYLHDNYFDKIDNYTAKIVETDIETLTELPSAQERKTGRWIWKIHGKAESGGSLGCATCSECGKKTWATAVQGELNFCPNCGCKMEVN